MSNTVDERVVRMQFDNTQFEQNVQTSIGTLGNLKQALNFGNTSKPLEGLNDAIKNNKIPILGDAVDAVSSRFSALEIAGITAIANITNSVVNKLKSALDAVTMQPLRDGFEEYETQMNSVQTIMANTGKSVGEVNGSLDVMNTYADKTIYNFQEMAANLGRFTAAGTELETSQQAIMGISNLAAVSGSNSQKASVAMYQLSQAIAAGALKLQDWNSVVNAGMGGKVFQDALQRTAQHMLDANVQVKDAAGNMISYKEAIGGTTDSIKDLITDSGSFRESLHEGWITTDVLTETLRQFQLNVDTTEDYEKAVKSLVDAGYTKEEAKQIADMAKTAMDAATKVKTFSQLIDTTKEALGSGWTRTWQIIFGDFEEAKAMWTEVSNVLNGYIDKTSDARNNLLTTWKKLGGRTALLDGLHNAFSALLNVIHPVQEAFRDVFKPLVAFDLFTITKNFRDFTAGLHLTDEAAQKVYDVFHGLFSIIHGVGSVFGTLSKLVGPLMEVFKAFFSIFLDIVSELGQGLSLFSDTASQSTILATAVDFVCNILLKFADIVRKSWAVIKEFYGVIKESFLTPGLTGAFDIIKKIGDAAISLKNSVTNVINSIKQSLDGSGILGFLQTAWQFIKQFAGGVFNSVVNGIKQIFGALNASGGGGLGNLIKLIQAGSLYVAIKNIISFLKTFNDIDIKSGIIGNITDVIDGIKDSLKSFELEVKAKTLLEIAVAVGILAIALLILSSIEPDKMNTGLKGMSTALAELVGALMIMDKVKTDPKAMMTNASAMILVAIAVGILAGAVKKMAELDLEQLGKGLVGVGVLLKMVSQFLNGTYFENKGAIGSAIGILIVAAAIRVLASSVAYLGSLDLETIGKGLLAIGGLLAELGAFTKFTSGSKGMFSTGLALIFIAASMKIFASAMKDFGTMDWEEIKKGLAAMGGALLELSIALNLMPKGSFGKGAGLVLVAASMLIVANAFEKFGAMDWDQIKHSLVAMGGALLEMGIALNLMPKGAAGKAVSLVITAASLLIVAKAFEQFGAMDWDQIKKSLAAMGGAFIEMAVAMSLMQGSIGGAFAILIMATALAILTPILVTLGKLDFDTILKGLIAIGGVFVFLAAGAMALSPVILVLLGVAAAMVLVAASFVIFGAGLTAIAAGILVLSKAVPAIPAAIDAIVTLLGGLAQKIVPIIGNVIKQILVTITRLLPMITATVLMIITNILIVIINAVPMILQTVLTLLTTVLQMLADNIPNILAAVVNVITAILAGIKNAVPLILYEVAGIIVAILASIKNTLPQIIYELAGIILAVLACIKNIIPEIVKVVGEIIVAFINAVASQIPAIINAAFNLIISFIDGLASAIEGNTDKLVSSVQHLIRAIINAAVKLLSGAAKTFLSSGGKLISSLVSGIKEHGPEVLSKVGEFISNALHWIIDHLPDWLKSGKDLLSNVASGIDDKASDLVHAVKGAISDGKDAILDKLGSWKRAGKDLLGGLISGIRDKAGELVSAAKGVVSDAIQAAKNLLKINSPSKVFRSMGRSIDEGFIVGMKDMSDKVSSASVSVASGIVKSAKKPLDRLADLLSSDIVDDPTITPVLDLSEIQNGAKKLYTMMDEADRLSLNGNIELANSASTSITRDQKRRQDASDRTMNGLINAINGLSSLIGNTGNVYNVNGVTYDDGSNISSAVRSLVHAVTVEGRA